MQMPLEMDGKYGMTLVREKMLAKQEIWKKLYRNKKEICCQLNKIGAVLSFNFRVSS